MDTVPSIRPPVVPVPFAVSLPHFLALLSRRAKASSKTPVRLTVCFRDFCSLSQFCFSHLLQPRAVDPEGLFRFCRVAPVSPDTSPETHPSTGGPVLFSLETHPWTGGPVNVSFSQIFSEWSQRLHRTKMTCSMSMH